MSSHGRTEECPICSREMNVFDNDDPVSNINMYCTHCGFQGNMKYDMNGSIEEIITLKEKQRFLDIFEEIFNDLTDEEKQKYLLDTIGAKDDNREKEKGNLESHTNDSRKRQTKKHYK